MNPTEVTQILNQNTRVHYLTWTQLKTLAQFKDRDFQYEDRGGVGGVYHIWFEDSTVYYTYIDIDDPANADQTDFEDNFQPFANRKARPDVNIIGGVAKQEVNATVQIEDFFTIDNNASTWFSISTAGANGDTIRVRIDNPNIVDITTTITAVEAGDVDLQAQLVASTLSADNGFDTLFKVSTLDDKVFISSREFAERGEYPNSGDFIVSGTGSVIFYQDSGYDTIIIRKKQLLAEPDNKDPRLNKLAVTGEIGVRAKADNPINTVYDRNVAFNGWVTAIDFLVPEGQVWFIDRVKYSSDLKSKCLVYELNEANFVENLVGVNGQVEYELQYDVPPDASKISITVDGSPKDFIDDYYVGSSSTNFERSSIFFENPKPGNGDAIVVTYYRSNLAGGTTVSTNDHDDIKFDSPLKLEFGEGILIGYNTNSNSSGDRLIHLNGFFEELF